MAPPQLKDQLQCPEEPSGAAAKTDVDCPADGNLDGVVDQKDVAEWEQFSRMNGGGSSWYDFDLDGFADTSDYQIIRFNLGKRYRPGKTAAN